jgi:hypothetical protein
MRAVSIEFVEIGPRQSQRVDVFSVLCSALLDVDKV